MKSRKLQFSLLALLLAALAGAWAAQRPYHHGPVSAHFDGLRFSLPGRSISKGLWAVLRWKAGSEPAVWPDQVPVAQYDQPPARVYGEELRVSYVGHATLLLQTGGLNILTDPIWNARASLVSWAGPKRVSPPGIHFEQLPKIDLVLVSHSHYDHMDLPTLARLREEHDPLFVVGLGNEVIIQGADPAARVQTLDWWQSTAVGEELRVSAVPVEHWSRRSLFDRNKALWAGFVIHAPAGNIYFAGDTGFGDGSLFRETRRRMGSFRLALLPIGAYEPRWFMAAQHVNPEEAVRIHRILSPELSVGMHHATFQLTDEAIDAPLLALSAALAKHRVPVSEFQAPVIGGVLQLPARRGD